MEPYIDERWLQSIGFTRVGHMQYELCIEPDSPKAAPVMLRVFDGVYVKRPGWVVNFWQSGEGHVDHIAFNNRIFERRSDLVQLLDALGIYCGA